MKSASLFSVILLVAASTAAAIAEPLEFRTRNRTEKSPGNWEVREKTVHWDPKKTAIVICDMWDKHWCQGATERVAEMAPRMNDVVKAARERGVFIIHAPSDTMKFYEGTPQRIRAQEAPVAKPPVELKRWRHLDPEREGPLPIDDSDGGCDDDPQCKTYTAWKRQIPAIEIAEADAITDSTEAYNLLEQRGIENVIVMGVHANMCVLGRPFSIRQMVSAGKNVLLMRDLTDAMYNSRRRPFVNHFRGTELVVEHIEKYWCPSITSADILGGKPFQFSKHPGNESAALKYAEPGPDQKGPLSPKDSLEAFKVFEDLEIQQVLAEPEIRQPLHLSWDDRGRLWVVEYIQYPAPAGLKLISKDQFWRAVYDKVPPAPPNHFKGADKITIHEDTDGDGTLDRHKTFVEGLNIVTAVEHGRSGVWVLNPPYLLFFPDKDRDDVVDADPEVHLAGFGLEDTHSVANSLRWGPDGWLYGAHGSTVTANIVRPGIDDAPIARMMGQGIWRYHPESKRFEVFAEGGGNAFGLEIDDKGRIFSGHNGGNTRGFHYVQGGYLQKGFEKHGPLSNPYAFGYFRQMAHPDVERFTHTFVIYGGGALPNRYNGQLLGIEPLQGRVVLSAVTPDRSSFQTRDIGYAVSTTDKYFKPVDIKTGPDGAVYIADWYDRQVTHTRNYEGNIDKSNGRIYRIVRKGADAPKFEAPTPAAESLSAPNRWTRQAALRLIADRQDTHAAAGFRELCLQQRGQTALEALWALHLSGGLSEQSALELLGHTDPHVRLWTVRLLGDREHLSHSVHQKILNLALNEPHVEVRSQLASTAKRFPAAQSLPLVRNLLSRDEDADDIHIPLLLWWALEAKAESDREAVLDLLAEPGFWKQKIVRATILDRLMRRYAIGGTQEDLRSCARILESAPTREDAKALLASFENGRKGRSPVPFPRELQAVIASAGGESLAFRLRRGEPEAVKEALARIRDEAAPVNDRAELIDALGESPAPDAAEVLLEIASLGTKAGPQQRMLQRHAIRALQVYDEPKVAFTLIQQLEELEPASQASAFNLLASRTSWAASLISAIETAKLPAKLVPLEIVDKLRMNEALEPQVNAVFGAKRDLDVPALNSKLASLATRIQSGKGDPFAGYATYQLACGTCHTLFGEGGSIGPDLTSFRRDDLQSMLMNIVNPSGEIREGYENVVIETADGRALSGFLAEKYDDALVLRNLDGSTTLIEKSEIKSLRSGGGSLMPEGLLDGLDEQALRDLFAYLRSTQPLVK